MKSGCTQVNDEEEESEDFGDISAAILQTPSVLNDAMNGMNIRNQNYGRENEEAKVTTVADEIISNRRVSAQDFYKRDRQLPKGQGDPSSRPSLYGTGSEEDGYLPIKLLNQYSQDWRIKVKLARKYPIRNWSNSKGAGSILTVDLVDRNKSEIQAAFFNEAAAKFGPVLQEGKVYLMSGGQVKLANKRFTTIKNDF